MKKKHKQIRNAERLPACRDDKKYVRNEFIEYKDNEIQLMMQGIFTRWRLLTLHTLRRGPRKPPKGSANEIFS